GDVDIWPAADNLGFQPGDARIGQMHVDPLAAADRRHLLAQRDHGPGVLNANVGALHTVPPVYPSSHRCLSLQLPSRRRVVPRLSDAVYSPRAGAGRWRPAGGSGSTLPSEPSGGTRNGGQAVQGPG